MTNLKNLLIKGLNYEHSAIYLLIAIVLALHFSTIMNPASQVFDEQYYVPAAREILAGEGTSRIDHPPLGQLIIAEGLLLFGDNPFGWRFFPIIFGIAGLVVFYLVCRRLGMENRHAYLASFLLAFENLSFIMSGVAMLDVFSVSFMLASFWLYLKNRYAEAGLAAGLSALCKLTGFQAPLIISVHLLVKIFRNSRSSNSPIGGAGKSGMFSGNVKNLILYIISTLAAFWLLMPLLDFIIWHEWRNPLSQVGFMLKANALATFATAEAPEMLSRPWEWLVYPEILTFWIEPHYVAMISPPLQVLIIPAVIFSIYASYKGNRSALFAVIWFAGTWLVWVPLSLITDRISYIYYFYPAAGAVCIPLALAAEKLEEAGLKRRGIRTARLMEAIVPVYLLLYLGTFVILSPASYWWKLPLSIAAYLISRCYLTKTLAHRAAETQLAAGN